MLLTSQLTHAENFPSFEVEYALQNAKCMLFSTVLFDPDCTTVSKWRQTLIIQENIPVGCIPPAWKLYMLRFQLPLPDHPDVTLREGGSPNEQV